MIEELIEKSNENMSNTEVIEELKHALRLANVGFTIKLDLDMDTITFKVSVNGQNLNRASEHYVEISFKRLKYVGLKDMVNLGIIKLWKSHGCNFYDYIGGIVQSYQTALNNLNNDSSNNFEDGV